MDKWQRRGMQMHLQWYSKTGIYTWLLEFDHPSPDDINYAPKSNSKQDKRPSSTKQNNVIRLLIYSYDVASHVTRHILTQRWTCDLSRMYRCPSLWDWLQQIPMTLDRMNQVSIMDGWRYIMSKINHQPSAGDFCFESAEHLCSLGKSKFRGCRVCMDSITY